MSSRTLTTLVILPALLLSVALLGCGGAPEVSPVGTWELRYQDAVGQSYLDVLELRQDGSYATHMQGATPSDAGTYTLTDAAIALESSVDPLFSREIPFTLIDDDTLSLMVAPPGSTERVYVEWMRSSLVRKLETIDVSARKIPRDLPAVVAGLLAGVKSWQDDAVPTAIRLEAGSNGELTTVLHFLSPKAVEEMRVAITAFDARASVHDGSRALSRPLPVEFMGLPETLAAANEQGVDGPLQEADVQVWGSHGAVWRIATVDGQRASFSAVDGQRIEADVTGYADQYEADWNRAGELWRQASDRWRLIEEASSWPNCDTDFEYECLDQGCTWNEPSPALPDGSCVPYY